jgi:hypothetical protein
MVKMVMKQIRYYLKDFINISPEELEQEEKFTTNYKENFDKDQDGVLNATEMQNYINGNYNA